MKLVGKILKWAGIGLYAVCAIVIVLFLTSIGGWRALNVLTGSMKPTIQPGALVLIHHVPLHEIKPGDVVTYQNPRNFKETITHRVVEIAKVNNVTTVTVKGDANRQPDTPFAGGYIVGRVQVVVPGAGKYMGYLHNVWALALLVIVPGLIVIWAEVRNLRRALAMPKNNAETASNQPPEPPIQPAPPRGKTIRLEKSSVPETRRRLDGMSRAVGLGLLVAFILAGTAAAATKIGTVTLKHNKFTAISSPARHPTTIFDCLNGGYKRYGFRNVGQCVVYVVQHEPHPPLPTPPPPPPPPKPPKPPVIPTPVIPSPPIIHHDAAPGPSATPAPSPGPKH